MEAEHFKIRKTWRPRAHKFDIGPALKVNPVHIPGYFVMRIFRIKESEYLPFYRYHLKYYLESLPNSREEVFLAKVLEIVDKDMKSRETLHYYNTLSKTRLYKLSNFRTALKQVDKWELTLTNDERLTKSISYVEEIMNWQNINDTKTVLSKLLFDEVGSDKFFIEYKNIIDERNRLKAELEVKQSEYNDLKNDYRVVAPKTKIKIVNGDHKPLLDLFIQMQDLYNPSTQRPYLSGSADTWASLLCNYFEYSETNVHKDRGKSINWSSTRDYFLGQSGSELRKSKNRHKFFHIKESKRTYQ